MVVPIPFLSGLSEKRLWSSYTTNPSTLIKGFQYVTQFYNLTFDDIHKILTSSLLPEEQRQVWEQAIARADKRHQANAAHPTGAEAGS